MLWICWWLPLGIGVGELVLWVGFVMLRWGLVVAVVLRTLLWCWYLRMGGMEVSSRDLHRRRRGHLMALLTLSIEGGVCKLCFATWDLLRARILIGMTMRYWSLLVWGVLAVRLEVVRRNISSNLP